MRIYPFDYFLEGSEIIESEFRSVLSVNWLISRHGEWIFCLLFRLVRWDRNTACRQGRCSTSRRCRRQRSFPTKCCRRTSLHYRRCRLHRQTVIPAGSTCGTSGPPLPTLRLPPRRPCRRRHTRSPGCLGRTGHGSLVRSLLSRRRLRSWLLLRPTGKERCLLVRLHLRRGTMSELSPRRRRTLTRSRWVLLFFLFPLFLSLCFPFFFSCLFLFFSSFSSLLFPSFLCFPSFLFFSFLLFSFSLLSISSFPCLFSFIFVSSSFPCLVFFFKFSSLPVYSSSFSLFFSFLFLSVFLLGTFPFFSSYSAAFIATSFPSFSLSPLYTK